MRDHACTHLFIITLLRLVMRIFLWGGGGRYCIHVDSKFKLASGVKVGNIMLLLLLLFVLAMFGIIVYPAMKRGYSQN